MKTKLKVILPTAILLCLASVISMNMLGCFKKQDKQQFEILLDWQSEPTYLGVYYAEELGYFDELGLDVEITTSWGANQAVKAVAAGKYKISMASGGATVLGSNSGQDIVSLGVIYPKIPTVIYGLADTKLKQPSDLIGKKIGIYPGSITVNEFDAFLAANDLKREQMQIVSLSGADIPLLRSRKVDAALHYWEMSPVAVNQIKDIPQFNGVRAKSIRLAQHGVRGYGLNIVTSREVLNSSDADLIRNVAKAIIRGYEAARRNPDDAVEFFTRKFPDKDRAYVAESLARVNKMLGDKVGEQNSQGWDETIKVYQDLGLLSRNISGSSIMD